MARPSLHSPVARAVAPIVGGILFFAALFGVTWLMAEFATNRAEVQVQAGDRTFVVGNVDDIAEAVAEGGPLLFPDLKSADGVRSIVLDHTGADPATGWQVYYAYPADRGTDCLVTHVPKSRNYTDCEGRSLDVSELALPTDVRPVVENRKTLSIDLRGVTSGVTNP